MSATVQKVVALGDEIDAIDIVLSQIQTGLDIARKTVHGMPGDGPATVQDQNELAFLFDAIGYFASDAERRLETVRRACRDAQS